MAHVTGSANNLADLLSAIRTACTANGWTLAGDVLHKGITYVRILEVAGTLEILGGTGIDVGNNLTGAGPAVARMRAFVQAFTFPMTYEVHINTAPDEVYVVVNYAVDCYQWLAWGISDVADLPGIGVWYGATQSAQASTSISMSPTSDTAGFQAHNPKLLGVSSVNTGALLQNGFVHHGFDGDGWNLSVSGTRGLLGWLAIQPLLGQLPNDWNNETTLLPILVFIPRSTGNKVSLAAHPRHARYARIDFHDPGDILTLGADQWKIYPWYRKDAVNRDGGAAIQHSGTLGWAVRYTGP